MRVPQSLQRFSLFFACLLICARIAAQEQGNHTIAQRDDLGRTPPSPIAQSKQPARSAEKDFEKTPEGDPAQQGVDDLRAQSEADPENLDLKLQLALRLSWQDKREEARELAKQIVDKNPEYLDAQILLARIDYWDHEYQPALDRVSHVRSLSPDNNDAVVLWAQIQLAIASELSWKKESRERARTIAFDIVAVVPDLWDAHMLISRIDLWDERYDHAFVRVSMVLAHQPKNQDAISIWRQVRLAQAYDLLKAKRDSEARQIAVQVTETIVNDWDAHLLIARVDAKEGHCDDALQRVHKVLSAQPKNREALELQADIGLWSEKPEQASTALDKLDEINNKNKADKKEFADVLYRRAQLALQQGDSLKAYSLAGNALEYDPTHQAAREIRKQTHLLTTDIAGQFEVYPVKEISKKYGGGTTITATLFPRSLYSFTLLYEYIYRFASNNHRVTARTDWRVTNELTLMGAGRLGVVEVVPREGLQLGADYQFNKTYGASLTYLLDAMKWPGILHRVQPMVTVNLPLDFSVDTRYTFGVLAHCGKSDLLHGVHIRTTWAPRPFEAYVQYDFGMELEQLDLPSYYREGLCPSDVPADERYRFKIAETRYHEIGTQLLFHIDEQTLIRAGYNLQIRFEGDLVHLTHIGIRRWF
jgi:tetratricopeptide (TPR) repeat protein